jgi:hypothetical protein
MFAIGNGVSGATFELLGNGAHSFVNGLLVHTNAVLTGNGTISGSLAVQAGGVLSPGFPAGKIVLSNTPSLQGQVVMAISKSGSVQTNAQIQVTGPIIYAGSLVMTNFGPTALASGDRFQIFSAGAYAGSFSSITLPTLSAGLTWANRLVIDGSMEVIVPPQLTGMSANPANGFAQISGQGGANLTYGIEAATNLNLPILWQRIGSNTADGAGLFQFTDTNAPGFPVRFYRALFP